MILAMDTSTEEASIALFDESTGKVASEHSWLSHRRHTVELMPKVNSMVTEAGLKASDLRGIAVALGPGSYTGLRIALSAAKGIVAVTGKPLVGIPTLDVTAYPHVCAGLPVLALLQAGRGRVCWALYPPSSGEALKPMEDYSLGSVEEMAASMSGAGPEILVAGEISEAVIDTLKQGGLKFRIAAPGTNTRRAGVLGAMAWERLTKGDEHDPITLSPIYLPREI